MQRLAGSQPSAPPSVVAIFGPTASGKTAVAEAVADRLGGEVLSADSMQAYRGLPILTAQPDRPTRLVGIWPLDHEGSVADYARLAHAAIDELIDAGRPPVVAGGTGLYLRAALAELSLPPAPTQEQRARWERAYDRLGPERAYAVLAERDPLSASGSTCERRAEMTANSAPTKNALKARSTTSHARPAQSLIAPHRLRAWSPARRASAPP